MNETNATAPSKRPYQGPESSDRLLPRPKRPKSSKACNACRKQKSRCERLAGERDACHRCTVIGLVCVFDVDPPTDPSKARKPRPLLPRTSSTDGPSTSQIPRVPQSTHSTDTARLHVLADTTEMLSRPDAFATSQSLPQAHPKPSYSPLAPHAQIPTTPSPNTSLSPETLSTVESTLFPTPRDPTPEGQSARFRADWRRWIAPLSLLQSLVRRNRPSLRVVSPRFHQLPRPTDNGTISLTQERLLKEHFRKWYLPWLPAVKLVRQNSPNSLDDVSPFLSTVICVTAARTVPDIPAPSIENLRSLALHHVGTVFSNPAAHRFIDSMYALLILVLWPLDPADDVALLINGAKQLANAHDRLRGGSILDPTGNSDDLHLDYMRLWYTICASETILNLGTGLRASPPSSENLMGRLGTASDLALQSGNTSDIILVLQTSLHAIVAVAIHEKGQPFALKGGPSILKDREPLLHYISTVHMILTRLGEWEIEFHSISAECEGPEAVHYAALEIEYHYLRLMLVTHCLLTLCHVCPLTSAPDEVKFALWSWSITGNKSAHAAVRLFNSFSTMRSSAAAAAMTTAAAVPLASAPDRIFAMLVVAVMLILRHQVAASDYGRRRGITDAAPHGFTHQAEHALRRAAQRMAAVGQGGSSADHHAAARYVEIMEALLRIWEEKRAHKAGGGGGDGGVADCGSVQCESLHMHTPATEPLDAAAEYDGDAGGGGGGGGSGGGGGESIQMEADLNLLGRDVFSDSAFPWDGIGSTSLDWGNFGQ